MIMSAAAETETLPPAVLLLCSSCSCNKAVVSPSSILVCGRCCHTAYCSKDCQAHHWPLHRAVCSPNFELCEASCGKGLRALKSFHIGEEIFREVATLRIPNNQSAATREEAELMHVQAVQSAFEKLAPSKQRAVMDLSVCDQWLVAGLPTPHGVFQTNSYRLKGEEDGGICLAQARINHSCRPNVSHAWRSDLQKSVVFATRAVAAGEELFTTYGPSECLDTAGRRAYLQDGFSFHCMCEMCTDAQGDDRMVQLHDLHASLPTVVREGRHKHAILIIDQCINLLCEQGIGSGVFTMPLFHYGYQVALMGLKDKKLARAYLLKQIEAVSQCEGVGCPEAVRLGQLLPVK
jgi:hypothetical protein